MDYRVLIIGLGSIAKKHIDALRKIKPNSLFYALRSSKNTNSVDGVINVYDWKVASKVDFILISNPTNLHGETILKAIEFGKPLFIEKPVLDNLTNASKLISICKEKQIQTYTAFVLRFHPVLVKLKKELAAHPSKIDEVNVYCGSYLPEWRPSVDFRKSYSANKELGGGVHLDLTHEIDYIFWLFGTPIDIKKTIRSVSHLKIDAMDYANFQLVYPNFIVNIVLNYYRKKPKRQIEIISPEYIFEGDLLNYELNDVLNNRVLYEKGNKEINLYEQQMKFFLDGITEHIFFDSNIESGIEVLKIALA